jgi:hypothetical protein
LNGFAAAALIAGVGRVIDDPELPNENCLPILFAPGGLISRNVVLGPAPNADDDDNVGGTDDPVVVAPKPEDGLIIVAAVDAAEAEPKVLPVPKTVLLDPKVPSPKPKD